MTLTFDRKSSYIICVKHNWS